MLKLIKEFFWKLLKSSCMNQKNSYILHNNSTIFFQPLVPQFSHGWIFQDIYDLSFHMILCPSRLGQKEISEKAKIVQSLNMLEILLLVLKLWFFELANWFRHWRTSRKKRWNQKNCGARGRRKDQHTKGLGDPQQAYYWAWWISFTQLCILEWIW